MKEPLFNWENIFKECTEIMINALEKNTPIKNAAELYRKIEARYKRKSIKLPTQNTFTKELRKKINLEPHQRMKTDELYRIIGVYKELSMSSLAKLGNIVSLPDNEHPQYIFFRLPSSTQSTKENRRILLAMMRKLKKAFSDEIMYGSYDDDTLVIMCKDANAKKKILQNITIEV